MSALYPYLALFRDYYFVNMQVPGLVSSRLANIHPVTDLCMQYAANDEWRLRGKYNEKALLFDKHGGCFYVMSPTVAVIFPERFTGYMDVGR